MGAKMFGEKMQTEEGRETVTNMHLLLQLGERKEAEVHSTAGVCLVYFCSYWHLQYCLIHFQLAKYIHFM